MPYFILSCSKWEYVFLAFKNYASILLQMQDNSKESSQHPAYTMYTLSYLAYRDSLADVFKKTFKLKHVIILYHTTNNPLCYLSKTWKFSKSLIKYMNMV